MLLSTHIRNAEALDDALLRTLHLQLGYRGPAEKSQVLAWLEANPDLDCDVSAAPTPLATLPVDPPTNPVFDLRQRRSEQPEFRQRVLAKWSYRCAITGASEPAVLDAAHFPGRLWQSGDNSADDGICLRADLHRLLDAGKLHLDETPSGWITRTEATGYEQLDGIVIHDPATHQALLRK